MKIRFKHTLIVIFSVSLLLGTISWLSVLETARFDLIPAQVSITNEKNRVYEMSFEGSSISKIANELNINNEYEVVLEVSQTLPIEEIEEILGSSLIPKRDKEVQNSPQRVRFSWIVTVDGNITAQGQTGPNQNGSWGNYKVSLNLTRLSCPKESKCSVRVETLNAPEKLTLLDPQLKVVVDWYLNKSLVFREGIFSVLGSLFYGVSGLIALGYIVRRLFRHRPKLLRFTK